MSTTVIYADNTPDGRISSGSAAYATARAGTSLVAYTTGGAGSIVATTSKGNWTLWESFEQFNTSVIGSDSISSAVLSLYSTANTHADTYNIEARVSNWGASLTTADWVAGASLSGLTLVCHMPIASFTSGAYRNFTDDAMPANVNASGQTYLIFVSSLLTAGTTPAGNDSGTWSNSQGGSNTPYLTITHAAGGGPTLKVRRSSAWTAGAVKVRRSSAWVAPTAVKVRRGGAWTTVT